MLFASSFYTIISSSLAWLFSLFLQNKKLLASPGNKWQRNTFVVLRFTAYKTWWFPFIEGKKTWWPNTNHRQVLSEWARLEIWNRSAWWHRACCVGVAAVWLDWRPILNGLSFGRGLLLSDWSAQNKGPVYLALSVFGPKVYAGLSGSIFKIT